jgi:hypothetical protein
MSRTSQALKRLGVAGVAIVTVGAGLPALLATSASAAPATQLSITPSSTTAATGVCETFTVTARDSAGNPADTGTVTIELTDPSAPNSTAPTSNADESAQFCTVTTDQATSRQSFTIVTAQEDNDGATSSTSNRRTIQVTTNANGQATFGVVDSQEETVALRAFTDADDNGQFDPNTDFQSAQATATFTAGNNSNQPNTVNQAANDAVRTITEVPQDTDNTVVAGEQQIVVVQLRNANGDEVAGASPRIRVESGGANSNGTTNNPPTTSAQREGVCTASDNRGISTCSVDVPNAGTDTFLVFVNQTNGGTPGPDASEPQLRVTRTTAAAPNQIATEARNIDLTPEGPVDTTAGTTRTFTATVTDASGVAVQGVEVTFTRTGAGRFTGTSPDQVVATTNNLGRASATIGSAAGETGQAVVTSTITTQNTQCTQSAGEGTNATSTTTAGNCSDSEVTNFVAVSASPSPTAEPTAPATESPAPTSSPSGPPAPTSSPSGPPAPACTVPASISLDRDTIIAIGSAQITVRATPNSVVEVYAYSRPSTTFRVVRQMEIGADGVATDRVVPPTNTRLYAQQVGCDASPSIVLNVRTNISMQVVRNGVRDYTFSGRALPARPGGLIVSLYRVTNDGRQVLTAQTRASATTGQYVINRKFTGTGRFGFVVRTGQDLQNAPGSSNVRSLLVF